MKYDNAILVGIFDQYDKKLSESTSEDTSEITLDLELELRKKFDIGYQEVKDIILAFYAKCHFKKLCFAYMMDHQCMEFDSITKMD